jgi:hypothetical protein
VTTTGRWRASVLPDTRFPFELRLPWLHASHLFASLRGIPSEPNGRAHGAKFLAALNCLFPDMPTADATYLSERSWGVQEELVRRGVPVGEIPRYVGVLVVIAQEAQRREEAVVWSTTEVVAPLGPPGSNP